MSEIILKQSYQYTFTVFTPTFNRAHTLHRPYESLLAQTFKDFEWLIVDDGSSDNTKALVMKWRQEAWFPIRYIWQENSGKHFAFNRGVREAYGELFLIIDSDDSCIPEALEQFKYYWDLIPAEKKGLFSGVTALCQDKQGNVVGDKFPFDIMDSNPIEINFKRKIAGDKWGFHKTEILRNYPFPEINSEKFIAEGIVWNRIALNYKLRFINQKLLRVYYDTDGLSASITRIRAHNPIGARLYYQEFLKLPLPTVYKIKNMINYIRFSFHGKVPLCKIIRESPYRVLTTLFLWFGWTFYKIDQLDLKNGL